MSFLKNLLKLRDNPFGDANPDRFALPADAGNVMEKFSGGGRDEIAPVYQDISIGPETPTPRTGMTMQERLAPLAAADPIAQPEQTGSQAIMEQIKGIQNKNYSKAQYDESGHIIKPAGADRDKKWSLLEKVGGVVSGILEGFGSGRGLLGAAQKGIEYGTDRNFMEKQGDLRQLRKLAPQYQQAAADEEFQANTDVKRAQAADIRGRPGQKDADRQAKFDLESQKQINRLAAKAEERRLKGLDTKYDTAKDGSGRVVIVDANGKEEFVTNPDGSFEYNLMEKPEGVQIEDGVNPDGTKKYKTVYAKGSQVLSNDSMTKYRDALMGLNREKFEYGKEKDAADRQVQLQKIQTEMGEFKLKYDLELAKFKRGEVTDQRQMDQFKAGIVARRAWIMANKDLTPDQKQSLLAALPNDNVVNASAGVEK
jgi:hypothetical protein